MNRTDRLVVAGLVLVVAVAAALIGGQSLGPARPRPTSVAPSVAPIATYTEGVLGRPTAVNPLAARTEADRDLVALAFESLVTLAPDGTPRPGLAASWTA